MRVKEGQAELFAELRKEYPLTMTKHEAANMLGISMDILRSLIANGKIKVFGNSVSLWTIAGLLC